VASPVFVTKTKLEIMSRSTHGELNGRLQQRSITNNFVTTAVSIKEL